MDWQLDLADPKSATFLGVGWSEETEGTPPLSHRWSVAETAALTLPRSSGQSRIALAVSGVPYLIPGRVDHQDVWLFVEGALAGFGRLTNAGTIRGFVPDLIVKSGGNTFNLTIVIPEAVVPAEAGVGTDRRKLGFALQSVTLSW